MRRSRLVICGKLPFSYLWYNICQGMVLLMGIACAPEEFERKRSLIFFKEDVFKQGTVLYDAQSC
jgi:hypothetical protein